MMTETASANETTMGGRTPPSQQARTVQPRLGEELPIFCEKCGYSLHGLPQTRCGHCQILQFHCPECGHHQPINTLRPAVQRILGRFRVAGLVLLVFFKLNFFGWLLFAWFAMGVEWSRMYVYSAARQSSYMTEMWLAFIFFAIPFGMVGRMLLLRWARSGYVGAVLAVLVMVAIVAGEQFRAYIELGRNYGTNVWLERVSLVEVTITTGAVIAASAMMVWPIWAALVRTFLPKAAASALLEWQRSQSDRSASSLAQT